MEIKKLSEEWRPPVVMIYGRPGSGKSTLAGQAPSPILWLDYDRKGLDYLGNARDMDGEPLVDTEQIWYATSPSPDDMEQLAERLLTTGPRNFRTLVIDSLTSMQIEHRASLLGDRLLATLPNYNENTEWTRRVIRALLDVPITVVITANVTLVADEDRQLTRPSLTPALLGSIEFLIPTISCLLSRSDVKDGSAATRRTLVSVDTGKILAKDRTGLVPPILHNPTWASAFGALYTRKE